MNFRLAKLSWTRGAGLGALVAGVLCVSSLAASPSLAVPARPAHAAHKAHSAPDVATTDVTISSFNVLGSSHTRHSATYATGVSRARGVVTLLDRHDVDVVGFQEMQADQLGRFLDLEAGAFEAYPGVGTNTKIDGENSVAWRTSTWELVDASTVPIPYFNGRTRAMPVVKLRNKLTSVTAWFVNVHNPATNKRHPRQDRWRAQAIAEEVALANRLRTGIPVFITGDMNERANVFCPMTGEAPMRAARGGTNRNGVCDAKRPWYVDWIFGTKRLTFTDYVEDLSPLVRRTTDHPVIVSTAHIDPSRFLKSVQPAR